MKGIIEHKWYGVPVVVFVAVLTLCAGAIAWAAVGQITPVTHEATGIETLPPPPTHSFALFEADGVTPLAQPIVWGNVEIGSPATKDIVIKNTGTGAVSVAADVSSIPSGWTLTVTPITGLAPGDSATTTLTLSTTQTGVVNFVTDFKVEY